MQVNDLVESEKDKKEQIRGQLPLDFFPEKQPTLSNFIVGSNSEAVAVISELKEGRGPQFSYLWGYEGVGKTHLVRALGKQSEGVPAFDENRTIYAVDNVQDLRPEQQQELFVLYNTVSDEQKRQVILEAASQTGLKVAPEVLNWIENNFPRDMHTMSNLLHSLDRYAMSAKRAVTIPLIKEWLERNQDTKEDR